MFSWMFTIACCLVVVLGLGLGLGLDLVSVGKLLCTRICANLCWNCHGPQWTWGKQRLKRWVLNAVSDGADVTFCGRAFQRLQYSSGDRKSSIADGWKTGALDDKRWWQGRLETLTGLYIGVAYPEGGGLGGFKPPHWIFKKICIVCVCKIYSPSPALVFIKSKILYRKTLEIVR